MGYSNQFFKALGIDPDSRVDIQSAAKKTGIPFARLKYYNKKNVIPLGGDLTALEDEYAISELELMLKMGRLDHSVIEAIQNSSDEILKILSKQSKPKVKLKKIEPVFTTSLGKLYERDCLEVLKSIPSDSVDLVFADPPFNLAKIYPSEMDDNIKEEEYLKWTESWLKESARTLKVGGALFIWNLPVWNSMISTLLHGRLTFKHWIATEIKYSLPIKGKLYPSHYSLLYFVKGEKANTFNADRLPTPTCPKCFDNLKDYGGYKHKMNPLGLSLSDVWSDMSPVRHAKYKKREGSNELPLKLLDRIIEMASKEGDIILDPFGGSGTTFVAAELKKRRWIGSEIGPCDIIIDRFNAIENDREHLNSIRSEVNHFFTPKIKKKRESLGLWTVESAVQKKKDQK